MSASPNEPSQDPHAEPDQSPGEAPDGSPSRPHGDPVLPVPEQNPGAPTEETDSEAQPGQMPESARLDINA
jgi:hypothetical protein